MGVVRLRVCPYAPYVHMSPVCLDTPICLDAQYVWVPHNFGHLPQVWMPPIHLGASKHMGLSKPMWYPNIWGMSTHMGALKHTRHMNIGWHMDTH